jgi:methionyl-tRNA formyltransferase
MAGDEVTGVQIMQMEAGLDTGPVLMSEVVPIAETDTASTLHDRLMSTGAQLWPRTLAALERGSLKRNAAKRRGRHLRQEDHPRGRAHRLEQARRQVADQIRGLSPVPGAYFELETETKPVRVKVHFAQPEKGDGEPGEVLDDGLLIACGRGAVRLTRLQREGKGVMDAKAFLNGTDVPAGTVLR